MSSKKSLSFYTEVEKFYFSPILNIGYGAHNGDYLNLYVFLGKSIEFGENIEPPDLHLSPSGIKTILKNMIVLKKANLNDISAVVERVDWNEGSFYYAYHQNIDFSVKGLDGKLTKQFYVKNKYDQVFKCLWNNNTSANTYPIGLIANNSTYYTIHHDGGTFDVGSLITIDTAYNEEINGTYKVVDSSVGQLDVICAENESYCMSVLDPYYSTGARIKYATLTTQEPVLGTGNFDKDVIIKTLDGYTWKYLYTIDKGYKLKFTDQHWMPVPIKNITKYPYSANVGWGSIDIVSVVGGGQSYTNGTNTVSIVINGDGSGASAEAYVSNNEIQSISILDKGYDYTYANVSAIPATGYYGSGAELSFSISPIGGHKFDLLQELYCKDLIISVPFDRTEYGKLPADFSFNQVGVIYNPYLVDDVENHSNSSFISCSTGMVMSSLGNPFVGGEVVYQGSSIQNKNFSATVLSFDSANNYLYLINTSGTPRESYELNGQTSGAVKTIQQINYPSFVPNSGVLFYVENRVDVDRNELGSEQIRILINYS